MNLTILSANSPEFQPLADLTVPNKLEYVDRWKCEFRNYSELSDPKWGRPKIWLAVLKTIPVNHWLWWLGTDTLITNMTKDWADIVAPGASWETSYDLIITQDILGINNDSFFIRHTPQAVRFLEAVIRSEGRQRDDQEAMAALIRNHAIDASIRPQREFNSYLTWLYKHFPHMAAAHAKKPEHDGDWQPGDFVIHFPAMTLEGRLKFVKEWLTKVER